MYVCDAKCGACKCVCVGLGWRRVGRDGMGSLDKGILTGFICRLCSEMNRIVLHIYGDEGLRLGISEKINTYLSINVSRSDPLPKTICNSCLKRLESQHKLLQQFARAGRILKDSGDRRTASSSLPFCNHNPDPPDSSGHA